MKGRREKSLSSQKSHDTGASYVMVMEPMAWQTDYGIMKEGMSILRGRKSVLGISNSERENGKKGGGGGGVQQQEDEEERKKKNLKVEIACFDKLGDEVDLRVDGDSWLKLL
nr:hypothetical protein [Tanacetum cinerariifolium]